MKLNFPLCALFVLSSAAASATTPGDADSASLSTKFTVASNTKVPGKTLKPGVYTIRVVDHLSDRVILEIDSANGKAEATFLGLDNGAARGSSPEGPVAYENAKKGDRALRGYAFAGAGTLEFVYPKAEAVTIAKSNATNVRAIDPASDGLAAGKNLSRMDMQMVTLWTLSPTTVGPADHSEPAIQAVRYQAPQQPARAAVYVRPAAKVTAPVVAQQATEPSQTSDTTAPASRRVPRRKPAPVLMASLPHTASNLPLMWLAGVLLLLAAGLRSAVRRAVVHAS